MAPQSRGLLLGAKSSAEVLEARAKARLADEYDAAQERDEPGLTQRALDAMVDRGTEPTKANPQWGTTYL